MAEDPEFSDAELDFDDEDQFIPSYRWSREQLTADTLEFASKVAAASSEFLATMAARAMSESNFRVDQEDAANTARKAIEQITTKDTDQGGA